MPVDSLARPRCQALLAYLLLHRHAPQSRRHLAFLLWPDSSEAQALTNLRHVLHDLQAALPNGERWLIITAPTLQWNAAAPFDFDVNTFEQGTRAGASAADLQSAVNLYRGDLLPACYDDWIVPERERLLQAYLSALEKLAALREAEGDFGAAIELARRLLSRDPLREASYRLLMRLHVLNGDRGAALRVYHACASVLQEELGVRPDPHIRRQYEQLMDSEAQAAPSAAHAPRHNLPAQTSPFVGRQAELAELARLLADSEVRLVTVVGLGGMGKTRLALEAGAAALERFADGIFFVSLAPLQSPAAVIPAVAQALGFTFYAGGEARRQLLDFLRQKDVLLILDSCEHLLDGDGGAGGLVEEILLSAAKMKVLATSRLRLGLAEEHLFPLAGMDTPSHDTAEDALRSSAVQLFLQGTRRVRPGFELVPSDVEPVVRICRLVRGMPLAILLAAAWAELLAPAEIAAEMGTSLDFLQTEQATVSVRQRSIRTVFDYSWGLLTTHERQVLAALSVFRGGFTREAAQEVAGASLRDLMSLTSKSLIHRTPAGRYEVHELLRQYAAEKLQATPGEEPAVRDRHAAYYTNFLQARAGLLHSSRQTAALAEVGADIENEHAAWEWAIARSDADAIGRSLESLAEFYRVRGWLREAQDAFARAAAMLADRLDGNDERTGLVLARVQAQQGLFCEYLGEEAEAGRLLNASLALARTLNARREIAVALSYLGGSASLYGTNECEPCLQALAIFEGLSDRWGIAMTQRGLAWVALHQGEYRLARERFQASVDAFRALGDAESLAESLGGRGYIAWIMGEYEQARRFHHEMLAVCRETGDRRGTPRALGDLGIDACGMQQVEEAFRLWRESLAIYAEIGDPWGMADELGDIAEGCNSLGRYAEAVEYAQQSLDLKVKRLRGLADWELRILGNASLGLGDTRSAAGYFRQALQSNLDAWCPARALHVLAGVAALLAAKDERVRALELLALVFHDRRTWQWAQDGAWPLLAILRAELPTDVITAAEECGRNRNLRTTIEELLLESGEYRLQ